MDIFPKDPAAPAAPNLNIPGTSVASTGTPQKQAAAALGSSDKDPNSATQMPWTPKSFAEKHNHKLKGKAATKAAEQANAMLRAGVPEGIAIATANKQAGKRKWRKK